MVLNLPSCELLSFGKTNKNEAFTYHETGVKKTASNELIDISKKDHINFNKTLTNICKSDIRKPSGLSKVFSLFSYQQKKVLLDYFSSEQFNYCLLIWMFVSYNE